MFCSRCGSVIDNNAVICPKCGCWVARNQPSQSGVANTTQNGGNGMAVAGFICAFLVPLLGWIFGGIGLSRSDKRNGKGKSLSIAAIVISTINFLIGFLMLY